MQKITRWSPDTCDCIIEYEWDSAVGPEDRTHSLSRIVKKCPAHSALSDASTYNEVMSENMRKNKMFASLQKDIPAITPDNYGWHFDTARRLVVSLKGITVSRAQRNGLQEACSTQFGSNKVIVE